MSGAGLTGMWTVGFGAMQHTKKGIQEYLVSSLVFDKARRAPDISYATLQVTNQF